MSIKAVPQATSFWEGKVFCDGERLNVANATLVKIAGSRVMLSMSTPPVIVRCQRQYPKCSSCPVVKAARSEERTVSTIVLDGEQAKQKASGGHGEEPTRPEALRY